MRRLEYPAHPPSAHRCLGVKASWEGAGDRRAAVGTYSAAVASLTDAICQAPEEAGLCLVVDDAGAKEGRRRR